ncbi:MAG: hypothetical protein U0Z53_31225 [Blastocatellia bacterium]
MKSRISPVEIISYFFDFQRHRTGKSILAFAASFVVLALFTNALGGVIGVALRRLFFPKLLDKPELLPAAVVDLLLACVLVAAVYLLMRRHVRLSLEAPVTFMAVTPAPHAGLIVLLSTYYHRKESRFQNVEEIVVEAADARLELLKSNWGPLVVACEHHLTELRHCWIVCSGQSAPQYEAAEKLVRTFAGAWVTCHKVEVDSVYDVKLMAETIDRIYTEAALQFNLLPSQIVADFTGGTATMSAGVILATMAEDRKIEYLRQDQSLLKDVQTAKTGQEIVDAKLLMSVVTKPFLSTVKAK